MSYESIAADRIEIFNVPNAYPVLEWLHFHNSFNEANCVKIIHFLQDLKHFRVSKKKKIK